MVRFHKKTIYETLGRESVHPFPARMAPGIALQVISESEKPLRILDPMVGSGTVVALARLKGHMAMGFDVDPLAVLISSVWTTSADAEKARTKLGKCLFALGRFLPRFGSVMHTPRAPTERHVDS